MKMKSIAMMMVSGCALFMLAGCGVKQELFDAKVDELNTAWSDIETLKGKVADLESLLNAEKAKVQAGQIAINDAAERLKASQKKEAETASLLADEKAKSLGLEKDVASAKSATASAREETAAVEADLAKLQEDYKKIQLRFEQFEKNMRALDAAQKGITTTAPKAAPAAAPAAEKSALDILDQMGAQ